MIKSTFFCTQTRVWHGDKLHVSSTIDCFVKSWRRESCNSRGRLTSHSAFVCVCVSWKHPFYSKVDRRKQTEKCHCVCVTVQTNTSWHAFVSAAAVGRRLFCFLGENRRSVDDRLTRDHRSSGVYGECREKDVYGVLRTAVQVVFIEKKKK